MINNRQNGRRRGRGGQQQQRPQGGQGSRDSGNRIDSRARGNASQLYEKYKNMASDAQRQGDRVNTEYYLQFADHYFRVMADQRGRYEDQNQPRRQQNDFDGDEEYGDEGEPMRADEMARDERGDRDGNRQQYDGNRQQEPRQQQDGRQQYDGSRQRADRDDNRQRNDGDRQRNDAGEDRQRDGQREAQGNRQRNSQPRRDDQRRDERAGGSANGAANGNAVTGEQQRPVEAAAPQQAAPAPQVESAPAETEAAPKRRGRPRKTPVDGGEQLGLDTSVLPPSIGAPAAPAAPAAPVAANEGEAPKPRRRRTTAAPEAVTN